MNRISRGLGLGRGDGRLEALDDLLVDRLDHGTEQGSLVRVLVVHGAPRDSGRLGDLRRADLGELIAVLAGVSALPAAGSAA